MCSQPVSSEIQAHLDEGVLHITLNRPDALNSLNASMHQALQRAFDRAQNTDVRAVLLTGSGRGFCAGQDLGEQSPEHPNYDPDLGQTIEKYYNPLIRKITQLPKPIICAVNGVAAGAGVSLALACDIVFAARSAKFIQAFSKIGLVPDSGSTWFLPHLIGRARAMALALTAQPLSAEQAQEWGLIWQVTDDEQLLKTAAQLANELAQGPTFSFGLTKQAMHAASTQSLNEQLELEKGLQRRAGYSRDFQEGVQAFLEKRKPNFKGNE
ncbi:MAG TPA: 2-(1,2-epoxy-1,2-dihydrophenyl)acetyl-CoA isomerase PaaG [Paenalcaligenes sp.]|nr:2-(1,2-epoxy-1,2-dihydrophenyl)acetyl-CoA isomerase PaaG [Paenalcaligenes sp.]